MTVIRSTDGEIGHEFWTMRLRRWHQQLVALGVDMMKAELALRTVTTSKGARGLLAVAKHSPKVINAAFTCPETSSRRATKSEVRRAA